MQPGGLSSFSGLHPLDASSTSSHIVCENKLSDGAGCHVGGTNSPS